MPRRLQIIAPVSFLVPRIADGHRGRQRVRSGAVVSRHSHHRAPTGNWRQNPATRDVHPPCSEADIAGRADVHTGRLKIRNRIEDPGAAQSGLNVRVAAPSG